MTTFVDQILDIRCSATNNSSEVVHFDHPFDNSAHAVLSNMVICLEPTDGYTNVKFICIIKHTAILGFPIIYKLNRVLNTKFTIIYIFYFIASYYVYHTFIILSHFSTRKEPSIILHSLPFNSKHGSINSIVFYDVANSLGE